MNKIALGTLALGISLAAPSAFAQQACPPGSWLCADITIGGAPPPVYVQQAPPPVVILQPRPRIYYAPPPPMVVYQPQPVYVQQQQYYYPPPQQYQLTPPRPRGYVGIQGQFAGSLLGSTASGSGSMWGGGGGLRFRGSGHLGAELAFNVLSGTDFNGDSRTEVPVTFSGLFYFNPQSRFQVYGLLGIGASWADVVYNPSNINAHGGQSEANYGYFGGQAGLGAELQLSPHFSLFADVRGFVRTRIDDQASANPEFSRTTSAGTTQTTNSSMGVLGQLGGVIYF